MKNKREGYIEGKVCGEGIKGKILKAHEEKKAEGEQKAFRSGGTRERKTRGVKLLWRSNK